MAEAIVAMSEPRAVPALHVVEEGEPAPHVVAPSAPSRVTADGRPEPQAACRLLLRWRDADGVQQRLRLDDGLVSVGYHAANHVSFDDRFVSGFHCRLHVRDGRLYLRDLGSTNGTFVDGLRVAEAELSAGSTVRVGSQELRVEREHVRRPPPPPGVIARDPALGPALELLRRVAPTMLPVTILGESGSGKEVAARALHELSPRAAQPFVAVNCGAIAHELAEAELFGHERGSFTGAVASAPGAFGAADGGTLFLDEVGDLPQALQVKLLRALEAGEIKPVGAARPRRIDVRLVCATHRDLRARVREGSFREDLYYRLRGVTVELPPLRARPQDILPLAEHFLAAAGDGEVRVLAADARAALLAYSWPGNARELRHVVQLAAALSDTHVIRRSALRFDGAPGAPGWEPHCAEGAALAEPGFEPASPPPRAEPAMPPSRAESAMLPSRAEPAMPPSRAESAMLPSRAESAMLPSRAESAMPPSRAESAAARPRLDRSDSLAPSEVIDLRGQTLAALEETAIRAAHERHAGNRRGMAAELGIARSSLIRKLDLLGLRERRDEAGTERRDEAGTERRDEAEAQRRDEAETGRPDNDAT